MIGNYDNMAFMRTIGSMGVFYRITFACVMMSLCGCARSLDLEGKQCPCVEGYVCDEASNTCRRLATEESGTDARPDVSPVPTNLPISLAAGSAHTCALFEDGTLRCWGSNSSGRLGYEGVTEDIGDNEDPGSMPAIDLGAKVTQITAGSFQTCALLENGKFYCWGGDILGDAIPAASGTPVDLGGKVLQLAAGWDHTCARLEQGEVVCWGNGLYGQLGYKNTQSIGYTELSPDSPRVSIGGEAISISAGRRRTCAVLSDGRVRCWGWNYRGSLGYHTTTSNIGDDEFPSSMGPLLLLYHGDLNVVEIPAISITSGKLHNCTRHEDGGIACFGANSTDNLNGTDKGCLGMGHSNDIGDNESPRTSQGVSIGGVAVQLVAGDDHTCALLSDGVVRCWGGASWGKLGYGNAANIGDDEGEFPSTVGVVSVGGKAEQIVAGAEHTCALLENGDVRCWGNGGNGRLGYGNTNSIGTNEVPSSVGPVVLQ